MMYVTFQYDYQKLLEDIYDNARWEAYYEPAILPILSSCCEEAGVKVVLVHETRKSGPHPNDPNKIKKNHTIFDFYARKTQNSRNLHLQNGAAAICSNQTEIPTLPSRRL